MDTPFPAITPPIVDAKWFSADNPCDEDAELTVLEQSNQNWLSSVGQQYKVHTSLGRTNPEPMEECESEEEEGNDESDESEESHDEDEEEEVVQHIYMHRRSQNDQGRPLDPTDSERNTSDQSTLWP